MISKLIRWLHKRKARRVARSTPPKQGQVWANEFGTTIRIVSTDGGVFVSYSNRGAFVDCFMVKDWRKLVETDRLVLRDPETDD